MNPIDSQEQELSMTDILSMVNQASDTGLDLRSFVFQTVMLLSIPTNKYMKLGNTVFILIGSDQGVANIVVYNVDTMENLMENYERVLDAAQMLGFQQVFVDFNENFLGFYDELTNRYMTDGYEIARLDNGQFRMIVNLRSNKRGAEK